MGIIETNMSDLSLTGMRRIHSFDEVFDAQKVFRLILTALSNPARVVNIKPSAEKLYGGERPLLAVAMTLLDNEVSFHVCGNSALSDAIISLTLSREEKLEDADYIFVTEPAQLERAIINAKCGTLRDPHKSATLIVKDPEAAGETCDINADKTCNMDAGKTCNMAAGGGMCADKPCGMDAGSGKPASVLRLRGPGIKGTAAFAATELVKTALDIRDKQYYEYPQGIDLIFVSDDGKLSAIPRLIRKEVL